MPEFSLYLSLVSFPHLLPETKHDFDIFGYKLVPPVLEFQGAEDHKVGI